MSRAGSKSARQRFLQIFSPCRILKRLVWVDGAVTQKVNGGFVPVLLDV